MSDLQKDIPGNPQEFRSLIFHFICQRQKKYSVTQSLRDFNKPLMVLIASEDTAKEEIENAVGSKFLYRPNGKYGPRF